MDWRFNGPGRIRAFQFSFQKRFCSLLNKYFLLQYLNKGLSYKKGRLINPKVQNYGGKKGGVFLLWWCFLFCYLPFCTRFLIFFTFGGGRIPKKGQTVCKNNLSFTKIYGENAPRKKFVPKIIQKKCVVLRKLLIFWR